MKGKKAKHLLNVLLSYGSMFWMVGHRENKQTLTAYLQKSAANIEIYSTVSHIQHVCVEYKMILLKILNNDTSRSAMLDQWTASQNLVHTLPIMQLSNWSFLWSHKRLHTFLSHMQ